MGTEWQTEERLFFHRTHRERSGSGRRHFNRGEVKYALLQLLEEESMHGYQMMKALEEKSCGTYKPSAGSIYPTLHMLQDQGFIVSSNLEGKKVFTITDEGRGFLLEEKQTVFEHESVEQAEEAKQGQSWKGLEQADPSIQGGSGDEAEQPQRNRRLTPAGRELIHLLKDAERLALSDATKAVQLRLIIDQLRHSLHQMLEE